MSYYRCTRCRLPCDLISLEGPPRSLCCNAEAKADGEREKPYPRPKEGETT